MKQRIVLLGPPASGKGTQAEMIRARYQFPVTSPGAMLREEQKAGTTLGGEAEMSTRQGQLAPDSIVNALVATWLSRHDGRFVFDGYPRSLGQASALDQLLEQRGTPVDAAFLLEADLQTVSQRVERRLICVRCGGIVSLGLHVPSANVPCPACGDRLVKRSDDTAATLTLRMQEYKAKTEPVLEYFRHRSLLHAVDAAQKPEAVFGSIVKILEDA